MVTTLNYARSNPFEIEHPFQSEALTYDFESAINIWSYVSYVHNKNTVYIHYHHDSDLEISREEIILHALKDNEDTYKSYFENPPEIVCIPETVENFIGMFYNPKDYKVGFNSDYYDLVIIAFILAFIRQHHALPTPEAVRHVNDLIISPKKLMLRNYYFSELMKNKGIRYTNKGKLNQKDIFTLVSDTVPEFGKIFYALKSTGKMVDIKLLNEKDKSDSATENVSLKRIAAQLGYRIVQPKGIDLSDSYKRLVSKEVTTLLTYNVSDVIVSYLIFMTKAYQNVLKTREQLLDRFKDKYTGRLNVNSTSAQFITNTLAPTLADKVIDNPTIETFFPVNGDQFKDIIDTIKPYYDALKHRQYQWLRQSPLLKNVATEEQFRYWETVRDLSAVEGMDYIFNTYYVNTSKKYGLSAEGIPRFRIRYGTLEQDLLEYMKERYEKFPPEVYELYSYYRGAPSRKEAIRRYMEKHPTPPPNVNYTTVGPSGNKVKFNPDKHTWEDVSSISVVVVIKDSRMVLSFSIGGVHGEVIDKESYERDVKVVETYNQRLNMWKSAYPNAVQLLIMAHTGELRNISSQYLTFDLIPNEIINGTDEDLISYIKLFITTTGITKTNINNYIAGNEDAIKLLNEKVKYKPFKAAIDPKAYKVTVDLKNVLHADVDSLYPSLLILLKVFSKFNPETFEWDDLYKLLRDERLEKKAFANSVPEEEWTEEHILAEAIQLLNKLLLNSASGVLDASYDTNVRANNKAMSMRLCGQLVLTDLVFATDEKGGESVSTNTDGVYLDKIDMETIKPMIEEWKALYNLGATPEIMHRFVSKDSNNRFEQKHADSFGRAAGGTIGNAGGASSSKKMSQPSIIDETVVEYFKNHENVDHKPETGYDRKWIKSYIQNKLNDIVSSEIYDDNTRSKMLSFMWAKEPSKDVQFAELSNSGLSEIQNVNRIMLVKDNVSQQHLVAMAPKPISSNNKIDDAYKMYHNLYYYITTKIDPVDREHLFISAGIDPNESNLDIKVAKLLTALDSTAIVLSPVFKGFILENIDKLLGKNLKTFGLVKLRKSKTVTAEDIAEDLYQKVLGSSDALTQVISELDKLSRQSKLNLYGWENHLIDIDEMTFMKESKVSDYDPRWTITICNEDVSHYHKDSVWNSIDIDAYATFVETVLDTWSIDKIEMAPGMKTLQSALKLA